MRAYWWLASTDRPDLNGRVGRIARSYGNHQNERLSQLLRKYEADLTVNTAEYRGLLLSFDLLYGQTRGRVITCGDSNLVIRQMLGEMDCKAPGLQLLRHEAM